jgi:vacuolar-type H+-ATPase subunit H
MTVDFNKAATLLHVVDRATANSLHGLRNSALNALKEMNEEAQKEVDEALKKAAEEAKAKKAEAEAKAAEEASATQANSENETHSGGIRRRL